MLCYESYVFQDHVYAVEALCTQCVCARDASRTRFIECAINLLPPKLWTQHFAELRSSDSPNISQTARVHNVDRSSLSRRFHLKTTSKAHGYHVQRLLNSHHGKELIKHIARLCDHCLPPTPCIVANIAHELCGRRPSKNWSSRFVARHSAELDSRYLNTLELARHKADTKASYEEYFSIMGKKIREYNILPENMYNMDEKGFLLGKLQKTQRVFTKGLYNHGKVLSSGEDGSREWVTVLAAICADGTPLSPVLIYKAASGNLQDTWLEGFKASEHSAYFTSSPSGWTSDELGFSWLTGLFDKETSPKARRSWRLLIVDGHGSHLNMKFLNWCESRRVLVAIYPPHSTHRLQPLDVGMFAPLSSYYSQGLDDLIRRSEGHTRLSKRDLFSIFWPAFEKAFTTKNIASSWLKRVSCRLIHKRCLRPLMECKTAHQTLQEQEADPAAVLAVALILHRL